MKNFNALNCPHLHTCTQCVQFAGIISSLQLSISSCFAHSPVVSLSHARHFRSGCRAWHDTPFTPTMEVEVRGTPPPWHRHRLGPIAEPRPPPRHHLGHISGCKDTYFIAICNIYLQILLAKKICSQKKNGMPLARHNVHCSTPFDNLIHHKTAQSATSQTPVVGIGADKLLEKVYRGSLYFHPAFNLVFMA